MRDVRDFMAAYLERVASSQSEILLTLVYWTVVALVAVFLRLTGRRLLPDTFTRGGSHWIARAPARRDPASLSRQY